jgi:iron uptake system component EfeO
MVSDPNAASSGAPPRLMLLAVAGAAVLALGAGGLFYYASQTAPKSVSGNVYKITVGDKVCEPNDLTVPAGRTTFEIYNASNRTLEWEILDGVMVVEERENITPGLRSTMTARLKPGRYQITCGLLSNPRGTLTVTASAESEAERRKPPVKAFVGPLSEYRVFLTMQSSALTKAVGQLAEATRAGDIDTARQQYFAARLPYRRLDMITGRFSDLKNAIDPVADYLAGRENDPAFTGFHRIEYGLFAKKTLDGLSPVADQLVADVAALNSRIRALRLAPEDLGAGVERQARFLADGQIRKGENRYAGSDLVEFAASLEGIEKGIDLLMPLLEGAAPDVVKAIGQARADVHAAFDSLKEGRADYPSYDRVDDAGREKLTKAFAALAEAVGKLNNSLGLE